MAGIEPSAIPAVPSEQLEGVRPRQQPDDPAQELAALRLARHSPATFMVQRQAVMIEGRPVVVPGVHLLLVCCSTMQASELIFDVGSRMH